MERLSVAYTPYYHCVLSSGCLLRDALMAHGLCLRYKIISMDFLIAGGCTLLLAIMITSYHSLKTALANPMDVLKAE